MNCNKARRLMGPCLYGDLTEIETGELLSHIDSCSRCRADVESRRETLDLIPDTGPALTDEQRDRMAWYVKGAVRPTESNARCWSLGFSRAYACGAALMLLVGFALGALVGARSPRPVHSDLIPATSAASRSTPARKGELADGTHSVSSQQPANDEAAGVEQDDGNASQPGGSTVMDVARRMAPLATTNRRDEPRKPGRIIVLDEPAPIVQSDDSSEKPQTQEKLNATTLPKATGLNDVQKAPGGN